MTRFYDKGEDEYKEYWYQNGDLDIRLHENNLLGHFHEEMDEENNIKQSDDAGYDQVAVLDPRDEMYFTYFRWDLGEEQFDQLEYVVRRCGSFLVRQTALDLIKEQFDAQHHLEDDTIPEDWLHGTPEAS